MSLTLPSDIECHNNKRQKLYHTKDTYVQAGKIGSCWVIGQANSFFKLLATNACAPYEGKLLEEISVVCFNRYL